MPRCLCPPSSLWAQATPHTYRGLMNSLRGLAQSSPQLGGAACRECCLSCEMSDKNAGLGRCIHHAGLPSCWAARACPETWGLGASPPLQVTSQGRLHPLPPPPAAPGVCIPVLKPDPSSSSLSGATGHSTPAFSLSLFLTRMPGRLPGLSSHCPASTVSLPFPIPQSHAPAGLSL